MITALLSVIVTGQLNNSPRYEVPSNEDFRKAIRIFQEYGMPLPPSRSYLVSYPATFYVHRHSNSNSAIGFRLPGRVGNIQDELDLVTKDTAMMSEEKLASVLTVSDEEVKILRPLDTWMYVHFDADSNLVFALQCWNLGKRDLARYYASGWPEWGDSVEDSLEIRTYRTVIRENLSRYSEQTSDDKDIVRVLREVSAKLDQDRVWDADTIKAEAIVASHEPSGSEPGSDDWLIDQLIHFRGKPISVELGVETDDPIFEAILKRGLEIVPTLIKHLSDERVSHKALPSMSQAGHFHLDIGMICGEILHDLATTEQSISILSDVKKAVAWWESVKDEDEAVVLRRAIFSEGATEPVEHLRGISVAMFVLRYPEQLSQLYKDSLDHKEIYNWQIAEAVDHSTMTRSQKVSLFQEAVSRGSDDHKETALRFLKNY